MDQQIERFFHEHSVLQRMYDKIDTYLRTGSVHSPEMLWTDQDLELVWQILMLPRTPTYVKRTSAWHRVFRPFRKLRKIARCLFQKPSQSAIASAPDRQTSKASRIANGESAQPQLPGGRNP